MPKPKLRRKPKAKKRKREVLHVAIVPLAEVLPLIDSTPTPKLKPKPDVNQLAAALVKKIASRS
jgi:hypothetical protein